MSKNYNICPECRNGKHQNCTNEALDESTDEIVPCNCIHSAHMGLTISVGH